MSDSILAVQVVARGLGSLINEIVFVGGAVASLYMNPDIAAEPRPTDDVDCIIELTGRTDFYNLEEQLRNSGFVNEPSVICRWHYKGITVDVMPIDPSILGFSNPWYHEGMKNTQEVTLGDGQTIRLLSLPFFIATKLEASKNRGGTDLRFDSDLEDIALILDGHNDPVSEIASGGGKVKNYIASRFSNLLINVDFKEALVGFLGHEGQDRVDRVITLLELITEI